MMRKIDSMIAAALLFVALAPAQDYAAKAEQCVNGYVRQKQFMGTVLVARDGRLLFRKAFGMANVEWDVPNTVDTKFRLGSITKQFTATLILQLVDQGKLNLDDPISKYYDEAPKAWDQVTIHHLLTHTSGIPSYTDPSPSGKPTGVQQRRMTPLEIIRLTRDQPLQFQPGTKFRYDNGGYVLLGYVIEKITGKPYAERLHEAILDPLGMKNTGYDSEQEILRHRASGYTMENGRLRNARYVDMTVPYAAGALYSTVDDLLVWDQALYTDKLLTPASKERMFTPELNNYACGWVVSPMLNRKQVGHSGGIFGFNTRIVRFVDDKVLIVLLSNLNTGVLQKMSLELAQMLFNDKAF